MKSLLLSRDGCLNRQGKLRAWLAENNCPAAIIVHPHHIHYFTGWWTRAIFMPVLVMTPESSTLALPFQSDDPAVVDVRIPFTGSIAATLVDDQYVEALKALQPTLKGIQRAAIDIVPGAFLSADLKFTDLGPSIRQFKRTKAADEVNIIERAISGAAAAFQWVRENLKPGTNELDVYTNTAAAAVRALGEPIGEFGNDFTCGNGGGVPRDRSARSGELYVLDLGVMLRGYSSDLCRTFAVSEPTELQQRALARCIEVLDYVESQAKPGTSCKALHEGALKMLDGYNGLGYGHHLGHGIGLFPHETPRLNKAWDDVLREGDVFACEPGLYGDAIQTGVRVEDDFLVTATGVRRLSNVPRTFAAA